MKKNKRVNLDKAAGGNSNAITERTIKGGCAGTQLGCDSNGHQATEETTLHDKN